MKEVEKYTQSDEHSRQLLLLAVRTLPTQDLLAELVRRKKLAKHNEPKRGDVLAENNSMELFRKTDTIDSVINYKKTKSGYKPYSKTFFDTENHSNYRTVKL